MKCTTGCSSDRVLSITVKAIFVVLFLPLLLLGCAKSENKGTATEELKGKPVKVSPSKKGLMEKVMLFSGKVEAIEKAEIYSKIPGKIEAIYAREGDQVKAGQLLIQIEDKDLRAAVSQAQAAVQMAKARLSQAGTGVGLQSTRTETQIQQAENAVSQAKASHKLAEKDLWRMKTLFDKGSIPQQQLDMAQTQEELTRENLESAKEALRMARASTAQNTIQKEDVKAAQAGVAQAEAALLMAETQLSYAKIFAPTSGVITYRGVEPGELVSGTTMTRAAPLMKMVNNNDVEVEAQVAEGDISNFKEGKIVDVIVDAVADNKRSGKVLKIIPDADPQSRSFAVKIALPNPGCELKAGMFAKVQMSVYRNEDSILIPREAVQDHEGKKVVFIVEGGIARLREVQVGVNDDVNIEIQSGLKMGDNVVIIGQSILNDGDKVVVQEGEDR